MNAEEKAGRKPPRKQKGQCTGPRRLAGEVLDAAAAAKHYGGTERLWYSRAARRLVPFRKWGGRLVFLRSELDRFFSESLSGCSLEEAQANDMARRKE
jgi:hypothetical protein